jgi:adenosylhomocysteine nucleosidase
MKLVANKLGLVVALPAEARALAGGPWMVADGRPVCRVAAAGGGELIWVRSGIGYQRARAAARWLVGQGVAALGVLGVSGGLSPGLKSGLLVVAREVLDAVEGGRRKSLSCLWGDDLLSSLRREGLDAVGGTIVTVAEPVLEPGKKVLFGRQNGALAVDMESAAVAGVASEAGLGLFALRAICDTAERRVPRALFDMVDGDGGLRIGALLDSLLRRPSLLVDLIAMQRDFSRALKALHLGGPIVVERVIRNE